MKYILPVVILFTLSSCVDRLFEVSGNGEVVVETREIGDFTAVKFKGNYEVILTEGKSASLEIETDSNLQEYIESRMEGNTLVIETTATLISRKGIVLNLTYEELDKIEVSGAADLSNFGTLEGESLDLSVSGAAGIELRVDLQRLSIETSGAGQLTLAGEAQHSQLHISGAGGVDAYGLTTSQCEVSVSGVGGAEVYVTEKLTATISGIGGITYKGSPAEVHPTLSGLGTIRADD